MRLEPLAHPGAAAPRQASSRTALITVCTLNHLHFARALVRSVRRHHGDEIECFVLLADWDGSAAVELAGAVPVSSRSIGVPHLTHLALKYSAVDLCCALKPYALEWLLSVADYDRLVYLDADIHLFQPLTRFLDALSTHNFVVTPHVLAPPPHPDRFWVRPSLGDLAYAGVLNAGMFGLRRGAEADRFLSTWRGLVTAPGAFMKTLGGQMEQNAFNWITCWNDGVHVLRDPAYNVAYWNLHERSLRWSGLDDPQSGAQWTVNGEPLVAYHFSGFSLREPYRISKHDSHTSLFLHASLARLVEYYVAELRDCGSDLCAELPYGFAAFPSGIPIDERMREAFKQHEVFFASELEPFSAEGEAFYCRALLSPAAYTGCLMPALFELIYTGRPDLQALFPEAPLFPQGFMRWIGAHGVHEYGYDRIFDLYRSVLPTAHGAKVLESAWREHPEVFADLAEPLSTDRALLHRRLIDAGLRSVADAVAYGDVETYYVSDIALARSTYESRPDVREAFPDPFSTDARAFVAWLEQYGAREHYLPERCAQTFARKSGGRALARIFSSLNRNWDFMQRWPLAFVGVGHRELAQALLTCLRHGAEFDLDDVLLFVWTIDQRPEAGLPFTLELAWNALREPSPLTPEGQDELLEPALRSNPRLRTALAEYRSQDKTAATATAAAPARFEPVRLEISTLSHLNAAPAARTHRTERTPGLRSGVNLFGFHRSSIGLGNLTRGLGAALGEAGFEVRENVLGNVAMDADLSPDHFLGRYDQTLDTNIFVSYPHLHDVLLRTVPPRVSHGRRNIVYLAWEQRDGHPAWESVYRDFDQIWALSDFAADSFRRSMRRDVLTVPAAIDFSSFPEPATKASLGLDEERYTFLYVFDANSSIERKNPEAVVRAFGRAFAPDEPVSLVLRVSNADRLDHRYRLRRLLDEAPPGADIRFALGPRPRHDLLRLISAADCYVSLHRAEGFGYTCAEAMAYARPVIATGYSGNLQFMDEGNSYLCRFRECEVAVADGPFQRGSVWAEPDLEHSAELMRRVYENRTEAARKGACASASVRAQLSITAVARIVAAALRESESPAAALASEIGPA